MLERFAFTDKEIDELIGSMVILVDTREKENGHITDHFTKKGIAFKKKALSQGDYSFMLPANEALSIPRDLYFDREIMIERKGSLEELSGNLAQQRDRFEKELALAPANKVLLIENASYADMAAGNYRTQYNKKSFWASLHSFWHRYGLPFVFIENKKCSGLFIYGTFCYYLKSHLK